jgi:hypothetical protein
MSHKLRLGAIIIIIRRNGANTIFLPNFVVKKVSSASGTSHLGMIDIQATTKSKYYDHNSIIIF